jgi:hypothetical protein
MAGYDDARRKRAVVAALKQWGNLTLAAERAKVSRDWVARHRRSDRAFDTDCRAAIEAALRALAPRKGTRPARGWERLDGVEVVIRGAPGRRTQVRRARLQGWSPSTERRFLETLAASCNVRRACEAVGLSQASAYYHRRQWQDFARAWDEALAIGYDRIEAALIEAACAGMEGREFAPDAPIPPMSAWDALQLLKLHQHQVRGTGKPPRHAPRRKSLDEVRASILRKLEAVERLAQRTVGGDPAQLSAYLTEQP